MATSRATTSPTESLNRVSVLLPLPLSGAFDYAVPSGLSVQVGDFVIAPLGNRQVNGVVWGAAKDDVDPGKLKEISGLLDVPPMPDALRRFVDWVAAYTLTMPGQVLRMTMSVPSALDAPRAITAYRVAPGVTPEETDSRIRMTAARHRVLELLDGKAPQPAAKIAKDAGVSPSVVRSMADVGLLAPISLIQRADLPQPDWQSPGPHLSPAQADAAAALVDSVKRSAAKPEDGFAVKLLDGVTGSGKTEVYFEAIVATLAANRQVLVLLPEIALTAQWLKRFTARFGAPPFEWHSDLTGAERRHGWRAISSGEATVVVGARSALFLPFPDLGLIIVDEEHDSSFKQEEGVIYNARDMAVVRARMGEFPVILSSATPSLETVINTETGRYDRLQLPERHAGASLPAIGIVDMRGEALDRQSWVSPTLQQAMTETLADEEQVMLFLNRRRSKSVV